MAKYKAFIAQSVRGGVTMVQLREKGDNVAEIRDKALQLQSILKPLKVPLIVNDFVELAAEIGADGVHIGQQDMSVAMARKILGPNKIIGLSIESMEELALANKQEEVSYITASAVFPSKTKLNCRKIWGLEGLQQVVVHSRHPVTAIGGIKVYNIRDIIHAGAQGIAVVSAIHDAMDPYEAVRELSQIIDHT